MSGMASTGTGSLGSQSPPNSKGAVDMPQKMKSNSVNQVTSLFSKKKRMIDESMLVICLVNVVVRFTCIALGEVAVFS